MIPYAHKNKGYKYLLTVIDVFSKFAWTVPVKSKTGKNVSKALTFILKKGRIPKNLQTDRGKEFYNKEFESVMLICNINLYSSYSKLKASICERFNRTLKNKIWKNFSLQGSYKWIDILQDLTLQYNNTKHRTIGMKPADVNSTTVNKVYNRLCIHQKTSKRPCRLAKLKLGDKVRISKNIHQTGLQKFLQ